MKKKKTSKMGAGKVETNNYSAASPTLVKTARPMKCDVCGEKKEVFQYEFIPLAIRWKRTCTDCLEERKNQIHKLMGKKNAKTS